jgi:hypothetical protein
MPTTDEKNILKILEEEGGELGELHEVKISKFIGLRLDYLRSILSSMGRRDLIDVFGNGKSKITDKGWRALGKTPPSPWEGLAGTKESEPESPEDKYKRWLSGKAKEEPKEERLSKEKDESESPSFDSYEDLSPEERFMKWASK